MNNNALEEQLKKAISYAFLLLKYRMRSQQELRGRLLRKKFPEDITEACLAFLRDKHFINDEDFARAWVESRIKKPLGLRRIRQELKIKGIKEEFIRQAEALLNDYNEEKVVLALARKRLNRSLHEPKEKIRQRLYNYLVLRGFSPDTVLEVLRKLIKQ